MTHADLKSLMSELGFEVTYEQDYGAWPGT